MKIRCDLSLPALYFALDGETRSWQSVEEECDLIVDQANELVALRIRLTHIVKEFPEATLTQLTRLCVQEGWSLERGLGEPSLYVELRRNAVLHRVVSWVATVDLDSAKTVVGFELVLTGDTDGEIQVGWLCEESSASR